MKRNPKPLDLSSGFKFCHQCSRSRELTMFHPAKKVPNGYQTYCKECMAERHRNWRLKNPGYSAKHHSDARKKHPARYRDYDRKKAFGMSPGTYAEIYKQQNGRCAICQCEDPAKLGKRGFHVDHCHTANIIRGLLCHNCNVGIGNLRHDENIMLAAIEYLRRFPIIQTPR